MISSVPPLSVFQTIRKSLARKPLRTAALKFLVALFTCVLIGGTVISQGITKGTQVMMERLGADVLFVPQGYEQKSQRALLRGESCSFYLPAGLDKKISQYPEVRQVTTQLFVASLQASCCAVHVQLIGFDPATDFVVLPWAAQDKSAVALKGKDLSVSEVLVGSRIINGPGDSIRLFGKDFTIAVKLDATGMGFDTSIFMNADRIRTLLRESEYRSELNLPDNFDATNYVSSVLVKLQEGINPDDFAREVLEKHGKEYNLDYVSVDKMLSGIAEKLKSLTSVLYTLAAILWFIAILVLSLVFSMVINERQKEFSIFRINGANRKQLATLVLKESLLISLVGGVAGVCAASVLLYAFDTYIRLSLQLPSLTPDATTLVAIGVIGMAASILTGPIACLPSIIRIGHK